MILVGGTARPKARCALACAAESDPLRYSRPTGKLASVEVFHNPFLPGYFIVRETAAGICWSVADNPTGWTLRQPFIGITLGLQRVANEWTIKQRVGIPH